MGNIIKKRKYFQNITKEQLRLLINDGEIDNLSNEELTVFFLSINDELKREVLDNYNLMIRVLSLPPNKYKKSIIDLVSDDIRLFILNKDYLGKSKVVKKIIYNYLDNLSLNKFIPYLGIKNLNLIYGSELVKRVKDKYNLDYIEEKSLDNALRNQNFNTIGLLKIDNKWELFIYTKFNILVRVKNFNSKDITILDSVIPINFLKNVSKRHLTYLLNMAYCRENIVSMEKLFISITKMYMALGYDNSKKLLEDNFTYATPSSIKRASIELTLDTRREYRLENQDKYYYYGIEKKFIDAFDNNDRNYFEEFLGNELSSEVDNLMDKIYSIKKNTSISLLPDKIKNLIVKVIRKREAFYDKYDIEKFTKYYKDNVRNIPIKIEDIYKLFSNTNVNYEMNDKGKIIPNDNFVKFLLGNLKKDNDCLLRMILNKEALGLNEELPIIINHYDEIEKNILGNGNLSMNSILDVIDISKTLLYQLKPDETDITLASLSKILNSRKYCTEPLEEILKRTLTLHKRRKKKVYGVVPDISGSYKEVFYRLAPYDDEYLLVSGIDTGSCFKVGGKGEDFLKYCLLNHTGMVFYLDYQGTRYVLPASVNGNMLNINSIDPIIRDSYTYERVMDAVKDMGNRIVLDKRCNIEIVTITDIHHEEFMRNSNYEKIKFKKYIPLNYVCYTDYMKDDVNNYIIVKKNSGVVDKYYNNIFKNYQLRKKPYIFSPTMEIDQERLNLFINNIYYTSINYKDISKKDKNIEKYCYTPLEVKNFSFIVGNKDWFIGKTFDNKRIEAVLPFDKRAKIEYEEFNDYLDKLIISDNATLKRECLVRRKE